MRGNPLCIELFAGRFGWGKGFVAEGFRVIGFDILHEPYHGDVPDGCELVLQDVLTLHGSQFKDAAVIVASPPCQEFSCTGLPFKQFKGLIPKTDLFMACWRLRDEAQQAAGRHIPLIVENVISAQKWVGRASWKFGSFCLWGDIPALMPLRLPAEGRKLSGNNSPRKWADRRVQRLCDGYKPDGAFYMKGSSSQQRKAASAQIAEIPFALSRHIARCFKPEREP